MNARTLCLALPVALVLALLQPVSAQDAASDQAKTLLKKGLDQYKALDLAEAKATLLKVDASALSEGDKKVLEDHLANVDDAIKKQTEVREAYNNAEKALKANELAKAKEGFATAAGSELLPAAERKDARAQLAQVDKRLAAPAPTPAATASVPEAPVASAPIPTPTPTPVAVAPTPDEAPLAPADADRAEKAKQLIAQGKAAMDKNKPDLAVSYFEQAQALNGGDKDVPQLLEAARALVAKNTPPDDSPLARLEKDREVARQQALLEFSRNMKRSRESLGAADAVGAFDAASDAARAARKVIEDAHGVFGEKEYRSKIGEADEQVRYVALQKDTWERRRVAVAMNDANVRAKELLLQQEQQRKIRVATLVARASALEEPKKYKEAMEVMDQVINLDPENAFVLGKRDTLMRLDFLRQEGAYYKLTMEEWQKQSTETREAEIPWYGYMLFPPDWRQLTDRRKDFSARAASETEADRETRAKLSNKIPKLEFTNLEFKDVIEFFRTASNANFHVNWPALQAVNVNQKTPVNLTLNNVTVEKALKLVLQDLSATAKITYIIEDGVVRISTKDDLSKTPIVRVYDIRDLIVRVPNFAGPIVNLGTSGQCGTGCNTSTGGGFGGCNTGNCTTNCGEDNLMTRNELVLQIIDTIKSTIDKDSWQPTGQVGAVKELAGSLVVTQTSENHEQLATLIESLRENQTLQVSIEARFITVQSGFLNSVGLDVDLYFNLGSTLGGGGATPPYTVNPWTGAHVPNVGTSTWGNNDKPGNNRVTPLGVVQNGPGSSIGFANMLGHDALPGGIATQFGSVPSLSIGGTFLDDIQVDFLVQATQAESTSRTLTAPRVTLFNGQRAYVTVGTQQAYVSEFEPIVSENASAIRPVVSYIPTGSVLDVEATVSADRRYVTMTVRPQVSTLNSITTISYATNGGSATLQLPNVTLQGVSTTVCVPDGGTLLLGGQRLAAEIERESGPPILSKIPVINRFFVNRGKVRDEQTLLILIRPKIIIPRELEEMKHPTK